MLTLDSTLREFLDRLLVVLNAADPTVSVPPVDPVGMRLGYNMPMMGGWRKERGLFQDAANGLRADYLTDIGPFDVIRYMEAQRINGSDTVTVTDEDIPFSEAVPMSSVYIANHARVAGKRPWVCVPHLASDALVTHMATMLQGLEPIVEYSNEPFNTGTPQSLWMADQIGGWNTGPEKRDAAYQYVAQRLPQIKALWNDPDATFVFSVGMTDPPDPQHIDDSGCDWVATAAYLGIESAWNAHTAVRTMTVDELLVWLRDESLPRILDWVSQRIHPTLPTVIYEGGLHTKHDVVDAAWEAWEHPDMEGIYTSLLDGLSGLGVELFVHYNGAIDHQIFGFKKFTGQVAADAPKWRALAAF